MKHDNETWMVENHTPQSFFVGSVKDADSIPKVDRIVHYNSEFGYLKTDAQQLILEDAHLIAASPELKRCAQAVMEAVEGHTEWRRGGEVDNSYWNEDFAVTLHLTIGQLRAMARALAKSEGTTYNRFKS